MRPWILQDYVLSRALDKYTRREHPLVGTGTFRRTATPGADQVLSGDEHEPLRPAMPRKGEVVQISMIGLSVLLSGSLRQ